MSLAKWSSNSIQDYFHISSEIIAQLLFIFPSEKRLVSCDKRDKRLSSICRVDTSQRDISSHNILENWNLLTVTISQTEKSIRKNCMKKALQNSSALDQFFDCDCSTETISTENKWERKFQIKRLMPSSVERATFVDFFFSTWINAIAMLSNFLNIWMNKKKSNYFKTIRKIQFTNGNFLRS